MSEVRTFPPNISGNVQHLLVIKAQAASGASRLIFAFADQPGSLSFQAAQRLCPLGFEPEAIYAVAQAHEVTDDGRLRIELVGERLNPALRVEPAVERIAARVMELAYGTD